MTQGRIYGGDAGDLTTGLKLSQLVRVYIFAFISLHNI